MDLILYHGKCTDGWAAAYTYSKRYPHAALVPVSFSEPPPFELVEGKDVLVVDFSWKTRADNIKLSLLAKSFRILDHHKTAQALLEGLPFATFDMKRSGAGLAWDYLFGIDSVLDGQIGATPRPWYINYVEDYDLWTKKLPDTDAINTYLRSLPHTKEAWDDLHGWVSEEEAATIGEGMLRQKNWEVETLAEMANKGQGWGCTIGVVNVPYILASDLGHKLAETNDIGMTWYRRTDGLVIFSLRSIGDIDVSKIAAKMGGGGHKNAAGFELPARQANDLLDDIVKAGPRPPRFPEGSEL